MDISAKTRFGLKAIIALSGGGRHSLAALVVAIHAPYTLLTGVLGDLRDAGLITCKRGRNGGYRLESLVLELTVADVMEILEDSGRLAPCSGRRGRPCGGCPLNKPCILQPAFAAADEAAMTAMGAMALAELIAPDQRASAA